MRQWMLSGVVVLGWAVVAQAQVTVTFKIPAARTADAVACRDEMRKTYGANLGADQLAQLLVEQSCKTILAQKEANTKTSSISTGWAQCGDNFRHQTEACDDGNTTSGDGCNSACTSNETCGNGFVDPGEACDDGNTTNGDGCESNCTVTTTTTTTTIP